MLKEYFFLEPSILFCIKAFYWAVKWDIGKFKYSTYNKEGILTLIKGSL